MSHPTTQLPLSRALWLILPAFLFSLFLLLTVPAQPVAASCGGTTSVSNETELNNAIAAFNAEITTPCDFTIALTQNINLTTSTTQINNATGGVKLVIEGGGFAVNGQGKSGVRPFDVAANTTVTMNDITVTGGNVNGNGGGIFNNGTLTLADSIITGNAAQSPKNGGGIHNGGGGALAVTRSTISSNTAGNEGGGISNGGALTVTDSTITGNAALQDGGGVYSSVNTPVVITGSTIAGNTASLQNGGGVFNTGNPMTIRNSTISGNTASQGGGIYNETNLSLDSVTINANASDALYNANYAAARVTIQNSILANSTGSYDCVNSTRGTVTIANPNLAETQNGCGSFTLSSDPQLGPLANNGGPTQTHALLAGSPALDAGNTTLNTDQRGIARPQGAAGDIGAYEAEVQMDFGDAPDTYGTKLAANGARHVVVGGAPRLGPAIDAEADGLPGGQANGDDLDKTDNKDDEDGVVRISGKAGSGVWTNGTVASGNSGGVAVEITQAGACLGAFVDFNRDGDFSDPGEALQLRNATGALISQPTTTVPTAFLPTSTSQPGRSLALPGSCTAGSG